MSSSPQGHENGQATAMDSSSTLDISSQPSFQSTQQGDDSQAPTGNTTAATAAPGEARRDPIVPPSPASGGIPTPTPAYLSHSLLPPGPELPHPRPILVVLDLNGTLLHRPSRRSRPSHFHPRPHAQAFLRYLLSTFTVAIWSSARAHNVAAMIRALLPSPAERGRLAAVWSREHFGLTPADFGRRVQCYKRLSRVWADDAVRRSHPLFPLTGRGWGQEDTVLVDDSAEKARSEPFNLVQIPEFEGGEVEEADAVVGGHCHGQGKDEREGRRKMKKKEKKKQKQREEEEEEEEKKKEEKKKEEEKKEEGEHVDAEHELEAPEAAPASPSPSPQPRPSSVLPQVHDYLNLLSRQPNISSYIREHPFRIDPNYSLYR